MLKKKRKRRKNNWIIVIVVFCILLLNCKGKNDEDDYVNQFLSSKSEFEKLQRHLNIEYVKNSKYQGEIRLIFNNPNTDKYSIPAGLKDTIVFKMMEKLSLASISIENEAMSCDTNSFFDRIYFRCNDTEYYPITYYVFDYCSTDSVNYTSKSIRRVSIIQQWQLLIDSNYP